MEVADKLDTIRCKLEKLEITQAWALRETDLFDYLSDLRRIDAARVDYKFIDQETGQATQEGQSVCSKFAFRLSEDSDLYLDTCLHAPSQLCSYLHFNQLRAASK